ncbi:hypothetical protein NQ176_g2011 [Zarea fungicola]|uniref:Uncharacterized protein n=1 Tax=Zarea fungicola TaxID=93591 RepID=A0ACC1NRA6_9HYPO|nr:hypothetical protein NQ176_g2011 [Lecanicillium fungicola]
MFENAPSEAFQPDGGARDGPVIESVQVSSAEEDLAQSTNISIKLADFGTGELMEWIQPEKLRAPEVILGANWDYKVDIWNLGLIIWELAEGQLLFDGQWTAQDGYSSDAHLAQITAVLGKIPESLVNRARAQNQCFDAQGNLLRPSTFPPCSLEQFSKTQDFSSSEKQNFLDFISSMIRINPEERLDAKELLQLPWVSTSPDNASPN